MARVRAPAADGEILAVPNFDAIPALVAENRRKLDRDDVRIGGLSLREFRALARREVLELAQLPGTAVSRRDADAPLFLAGHQPELAHPGVWVKNFALYGLAKKLGAIPLHLIVDNDTLKSTSIHFPTIRERDPTSVRLETLPFDNFAGEVPYECRSVLDPQLFQSFPDRAAQHCANWGFEPLMTSCWPSGECKPPVSNIGKVFTSTRRDCEQAWGCKNLELPVSWLATTHAFDLFFTTLTMDLPRFLKCYNAAVEAHRDKYGIRSGSHPVPNLATNGTWYESPFWQWSSGEKRKPVHISYNEFAPGYMTVDRDTEPDARVRPRALTLTLFARVCLGDFFIHGIGGGKYDEVTDAIIRDYFGIDPPAYQILSATLHLPLPAFPSTVEDVERAARQVRDLQWNPQAYVSPETARTLLQRHAALAANEPLYRDHAARQRWFRELQQVKEQLRQLVADRVPEAEAALKKATTEAAGNAILKRRDYSWVLYPEETLRPFLQRFLEV